MTKKHLVNIAKMIKATKTKKELVKSLIKYFEAENPLFNKKRFLEAIK